MQVHLEWPEEILIKLQQATIIVLNEKAAGGTPASVAFAEVLDNMKHFAKNEQDRFAFGNTPREKRFVGWPGWGSSLD